MTTQTTDFSEIDLTGGLRFNGEAIGSAYYNGERLWPFGPDLLYTGGIGGASYLPDPADVYGGTGLAEFGSSMTAILDEKNGTPVFGLELVTNGSFDSGVTGWTTMGSTTISTVSGAMAVNQPVAGSWFAENVRLITPVLTVGKFYRIEFDVRNTSGVNSLRLANNAAVILDMPTINANFQRFSAIFQCNIANTFSFFKNGGTGTFELDNISVREVPGTPALQPSTSLRPLLGRAPKVRRNLLTRTEEFDNAAWVKEAANVTANTSLAPNGTTTAETLTEDGTTTFHQVRNNLAPVISGTSYVYSVYAKLGNGVRGLHIRHQSTPVNFQGATFDLSSGAISSAGTGIVASATDVGSGWWRCSITFIANGTGANAYINITNAGAVSYTGDGTSGILIWGAQLELGSTATPYQRVGTAVDVTEAGVPSYPFVRFDLSDDRLDTTGIRSQKNLLLATEEFDNAAWVLQGAGTGVPPTRTLSTGTSPAGVTACRLQFSLGGGSATTDLSIFRQSAAAPSGSGVFSVWLRSTDGTSSYGMQLTDPSGNGQNITVTGSWQRFQATGTSTGAAVNYQLRLRGGQSPANSNTADVLFSEPQLETGSTATAYEYGGFSGDIIVAGRNGSAITPAVKIPDGNFSLGSTTYTGGTPGILRGIGDVVGWSLLRKNMTVAERERIMRFYKRRGAKGLLVPGPELVVNGDFSSGTTGWILDTAWTVSNSRLVCNSPSGPPQAYQSFSRPGIYIASVELTSYASGIPQIGFVAGGGSIDNLGSTLGPKTYILIASAPTRFGLRNLLGTGSFEVDNVSLRELRPEEEW